MSELNTWHKTYISNYYNREKGADKKEEEKVETSALVPQVIKVKTEKAEGDAEPSEENENAGLSLMEIHKKKMEKGKGFINYKKTENNDF